MVIESWTIERIDNLSEDSVEQDAYIPTMLNKWANRLNNAVNTDIHPPTDAFRFYYFEVDHVSNRMVNNLGGVRGPVSHGEALMLKIEKSNNVTLHRRCHGIWTFSTKVNLGEKNRNGLELKLAIENSTYKLSSGQNTIILESPSQTHTWSERDNKFVLIKNQGGAAARPRVNKTVTSATWVPSKPRRTVRIADGSVRVLYSNPRYPGQHRIRKGRRGGDGRITYSYVKAPTSKRA